MDLDTFVRIKKYFRHDFQFGIEGAHGIRIIEADPSSFKLLRQAHEQGHPIVMRPTEYTADQFVLTDRIDEHHLRKQHKREGEYKPGRMVLKLENEIYRAWLRFRARLRKEDKITVMKALGVRGRTPLNRWSPVPGFGCELIHADTILGIEMSPEVLAKIRYSSSSG